MGIEIERRFIVDAVNQPVWANVTPTTIRQGYVARDDKGTICRIRIAGENAWLTLKGKTVGAARSEFEFSIPLSEARDALSQLGLDEVITKQRFILSQDDLRWEIDVFSGLNAGLIIAEIELPAIDTPLHLPHWVGTEITDQYQYANSNLAARPYTTWEDEERVAP